MGERTFVLAVDASCSAVDLERIQQYVSTSPDFGSWWNHIPMVFMLESAMPSEDIAARLHAMAPNTRFLLAEVNLAAAQGWLPEISWKWIEKRALPATQSVRA
jgi:hypothetical protein